ncbi:putative pyrroloquinoline-quinone binding quinoprotein [Stackebrandtia endophytica]|uniref:Putative pyrroloquinoline-quinone binding quinoprotein n=1 Tax=Stackebrandtia endophytica TaxID=1496996 RepID=A0A543AWN3_9ACTN|nr:PQQ-binding-like beta-propeller repeat protein [Stackebrandtia endophytica]TQL76985.1 putative pyrroloquinoline-quinone binding quinoprotein [Stackebrandtia endophytica]
MQNAIHRISATLLVVAILSACGSTPNEPGKIDPVWTGSVPETAAAAPAPTVPELALVGEHIVMRTLETVTVSSLDGETQREVNFDDLRIDLEVPLDVVPQVTVYPDHLVVSGPEVGTTIMSLASGEVTYRDEHRQTTTETYLDSFLTIMCETGNCDLTARSIPDGDELWSVPIEGRSPVFLTPSDRPQSMMSQMTDIYPAMLRPFDADLALVRETDGSERVTSVDISNGEAVATYDIPLDNPRLQLISPTIALSWTEPDSKCEITIEAFDVQTWTPAWETTILNRSGDIASTFDTCSIGIRGPRITDGKMLAVDVDEHPIAIDSITGEIVWRAEEPGGIPIGFTADTVITAAYADDFEDFIAYSATSGDTLWTSRFSAAVTGMAASIGMSEAVLAFESPGTTEGAVDTIMIDIASGASSVAQDAYLVSVSGTEVFTVNSVESGQARTASLFRVT